MASVRPGVGVEITREPVGAVGIITPWNFPIAIPARKIAPALACGNCVVFKPADLVPGAACALANILSRSGLPAGVFNLVMGRGSDVGATLLSDARVATISFTGSDATDNKVAQNANGKAPAPNPSKPPPTSTVSTPAARSPPSSQTWSTPTAWPFRPTRKSSMSWRGKARPTAASGATTCRATGL